MPWASYFWCLAAFWDGNQWRNTRSSCLASYTDTAGSARWGRGGSACPSDFLSSEAATLFHIVDSVSRNDCGGGGRDRNGWRKGGSCCSLLDLRLLRQCSGYRGSGHRIERAPALCFLLRDCIVRCQTASGLFVLVSHFADSDLGSFVLAFRKDSQRPHNALEALISLFKFCV
jgi:hypothetical protein